jgi:hypothetical protein
MELQPNFFFFFFDDMKWNLSIILIYFFMDKVRKLFFHLFVLYLYFLLWKMSIYAFCQFLIGLFIFLVLIYLIFLMFLCILNINSLSNDWLTKIISYTVGFPLTLVNISFAAQKFFNLMYSYSSILAIYFLSYWSSIQKVNSYAYIL